MRKIAKMRNKEKKLERYWDRASRISRAAQLARIKRRKRHWWTPTSCYLPGPFTESVSSSSGSNVISNRKTSMDKAQNAPKREIVMVWEATWSSWLVVCHSPNDQQAQSNSQWNPDHNIDNQHQHTKLRVVLFTFEPFVYIQYFLYFCFRIRPHSSKVLIF